MAQFVVVKAALALLLLSGCDYIFRLDDPKVRDSQLDVDPANCPSDFDVIGNSRYKVLIPPADTVPELYGACADAYPNGSHLAAIDDATELAAVIAYTKTKFADDFAAFYIGAVQLRDQPARDDGWIQITGGVLPALWNENEPDDASPTEMNVQQFVVIEQSANGFLDTDVETGRFAVCECDGHPIASEFMAAYLASIDKRSRVR